MIKELHLMLDTYGKNMCVTHSNWQQYSVIPTYVATKKAVEACEEIVYTTIPHFLQFRYAERLFVHVGSENGIDVHEIKKGYHESNGTHREIRERHNIEKLLLAGEFSWYK